VRRNLLVVDPDPQTADLVRIVSDCRIESAANEVEGLGLAKTGIFDLYIVDERLPDGSGVQLCKQIRSFDRNTPIIFLFGGASKRDHQAAVDAGANACIDRMEGSSRLRDTTGLLLRWAEDISLNSRIAELAAIRDSIEEELIELDVRAEESTHKAKLARERLMATLAGRHDVTDKAYRAFIAAGGTKAYFERWWPNVLDEVI